MTEMVTIDLITNKLDLVKKYYQEQQEVFKLIKIYINQKYNIPDIKYSIWQEHLNPVIHVDVMIDYKTDKYPPDTIGHFAFWLFRSDIKNLEQIIDYNMQMIIKKFNYIKSLGAQDDIKWSQPEWPLPHQKALQDALQKMIKDKQ